MRSPVCFSYVILLLAVVGLSGCDRPAAEVTLRIGGDSLIPMTDRELDDGSRSHECVASFTALAEGPDGSRAVMQGGRVEYFWWQTNSPAGSHDWNTDGILRLWVDTVFTVGHERRSWTHGFGQSAPPQPIRASVTFDYTGGDDSETRRTEPYRFYCY
jgi:hypothetical protein